MIMKKFTKTKLVGALLLAVIAITMIGGITPQINPPGGFLTNITLSK